MIPHDYNTLWDGTCVSLSSKEPLAFSTVAGALARLARWNGQSILGSEYTVLHHSYAVYLLLVRGEKSGPVSQMLGLWHDAHEIATADIPSPWKTQDMRDTQRLLDHHFYQYTLKLPFPNEPTQELVHAADRAVLTGEARVLMPRQAQVVFDDEPLDPVVESVVREIARIPVNALVLMWIDAVKRLLDTQELKRERERAS